MKFSAEAFPRHLCCPVASARSRGFSTIGVFISILVAVALLASALGYYLQLKARLTLAESETRMMRVSHELITQELEIERKLGTQPNSDISQLATVQIVNLQPSPSPWVIEAMFDVVWSESNQLGVLSMHAKTGEIPDYNLQLRLLGIGDEGSPKSITIPTRAVPDVPRKRWFDTSSLDPMQITGFELIMLPDDDSADAIRFSGELSP
jgi:hypothetical protein